jgi:hypothetical protein
MHLSLHYAVIAALVALALAATPALARPIDSPDRDDSPTSSLAGTTQPRQDLRGEHARDAARAAEQPQTAPVYWSYDYQAPTPHPATATAPDDGTDAPAIGGAILGGLILAAGAVVATKSRRVATA